MNPKLFSLTALFLMSCVSHEPAETAATSAASMEEIRYVSSDLGRVMVFSNGRARSGPLVALSPEFPTLPAEYSETSDHVRCLSIGPPGSTAEFAIKKPIRAGERYECLQTSFLVTRCFADCRSAIIERTAPSGVGSGRGVLKSYLHVDSCLGVLVYSDSGNLSEGIPLDAMWLRGKVGVLANRHSPECKGYS